MRNWLTDRFDLSVPVISAPMAGPGDGRLAAAVSAAGGLGMIGVGGARDAHWIAEQAEVAGDGGRPFGFGLMAWVQESRPEQLEAVIEAAPALVSVSFGDVAPHLARLREAGICCTTQVNSRAEAVRAQDAGVDLIVARGAEAGGHGRDAVGTLPLLEIVLDAVDVPVVAAGGIGTRRGLAAVLAAGAVGAWAGTAFLGCVEAANTSAARQRLFAAEETGTAYGRVFDVAQRLRWPQEYGGRGLRNAYFDTWSDRLDELAEDQEARDQLVEARNAEDFDTAYLYAGQGVGLLRAERTAADVLAEFARADDLLRRFDG